MNSSFTVKVTGGEFQCVQESVSRLYIFCLFRLHVFLQQPQTHDDVRFWVWGVVSGISLGKWGGFMWEFNGFFVFKWYRIAHSVLSFMVEKFFQDFAAFYYNFMSSSTRISEVFNRWAVINC